MNTHLHYRRSLSMCVVASMSILVATVTMALNQASAESVDTAVEQSGDARGKLESALEAIGKYYALEAVRQSLGEQMRPQFAFQSALMFSILSRLQQKRSLDEFLSLPGWNADNKDVLIMVDEAISKDIKMIGGSAPATVQPLSVVTRHTQTYANQSSARRISAFTGFVETAMLEMYFEGNDPGHDERGDVSDISERSGVGWTVITDKPENLLALGQSPKETQIDVWIQYLVMRPGETSESTEVVLRRLGFRIRDGRNLQEKHRKQTERLD